MSIFSIPWNTAASSNGTHTIYAVITDFSGNQTTTSTITVTASNTEPSTEPPTPDPTPTVVPTTVESKPIPLGAVFYNTLGELSTFNAIAVFPSAIDPDINSDNLNNDEWINVRDEGAIGDGTTDDTEAIQSAIDKAAVEGKKVLIPAGFTFKVGFPNMDSWWNGYWGAMAVSLWLDDNAKIMLEGTITPYHVPGDLLEWCSGGVIFENRKSFKFISGAAASLGDYFPTDYTGERQGLDETGGAHTNGVSSTTIQLTGSPDLSEFVAERYLPIPEGTLVNTNRNLGLRIFNSPYQTEILSVDNTNKTLTVVDPLNIPSGSPVEYTIENNDFNENIHIFGSGTIDWRPLTEAAPVAIANDGHWLGRFYRCKNLVIEGITMHGFGTDGLQIGWSQHVTLRDLNFRDAYPDSGASCINFDVCRDILADNCRFYDNPVQVGIFSWASRDIKIINCVAKDMSHAEAGFGGLFMHQGYGMEFVGTSFPTNMVEGIGYFDIVPEEIWGEHDFGSITLDTLGDAIDWNILVQGCTSTRNGYGLVFLAETYYGGFGKGIICKNNHITSNWVIGIGLGSTYGTIIEGNYIANNGFGRDTTKPYSAIKSNYGANDGYEPYFD